MIKDDRILKPRLRLCPFCGVAGAPELRTSGDTAFVHCSVCNADGPTFYISNYISADFHSMTCDEQNREWGDAKAAALHNALIAWGGRPWEGSFFPDELADFEKSRMSREEDV